MSKIITGGEAISLNNFGVQCFQIEGIKNGETISVLICPKLLGNYIPYVNTAGNEVTITEDGIVKFFREKCFIKFESNDDTSVAKVVRFNQG